MTSRRKPPASTMGVHLLAEYSACDPAILNDISAIETLMLQAAESAGATIIHTKFHPFHPTGLSGVVMLKESHISIHTWPDEGYASADFYTCGACEPHQAHALISAGLCARETELIEVRRGRRGKPRSTVLGHIRAHTVSFDCRTPALPTSVTVKRSPGRGLGLVVTRDFIPGELVYKATARFYAWNTQFIFVTDLDDSFQPASDAGYELGLPVLEQLPGDTVEALARHYQIAADDLTTLHQLLTDEQEQSLVIGFDALVNHSNVPNALLDWRTATVQFVEGAPWFSVALRTCEPLQAGDELFVDYRISDARFTTPKSWLA